MDTYKVTYERDEGGWWIARLHGVPGVHSNGRTIGEARRRVREALSLAVGDRAAERARLEDDVRLPADLRKGLAQAVAARTLAEESASRAVDSTARAARLLRDRLGLSVRDVGELLGLSHQRIQQLCREDR